MATAHIPSQEAREQKELLRQRLYWVKLGTGIRNRIHGLLDK
ncbi:MAG: hypothetical protein AAGA18_10615 [Verrucomicrobiota bacterium]